VVFVDDDLRSGFGVVTQAQRALQAEQVVGCAEPVVALAFALLAGMVEKDVVLIE